jgi:PAS domain S-box-containing protein
MSESRPIGNAYKVRNRATAGRSNASFDAGLLSVDLLENAVLAIDRDGRIIYFNPGAETLLGYSRGEVMGKQSEMLFTESGRPEHIALRERFFTDPGARVRNHVREPFYRRKDGRNVHLERTIVGVETEEGLIAVVTLRDLTERDEHDFREGELRHKLEELQEQLVRRTAEWDEGIDDLDAVSYAVFHDLQAPLKAMQMYAKALIDDEGDTFSSSVREFMKQVVDAVTRMDTLAQRILDYRRVMRMEVVMHPIGVRETFNDVLGYLSPYVHESKAEVSITGSPAIVLADRETLFHVLVNLITNAIKYAQRRRTPRVTLGAEPTGEIVSVWVEDNGVGIPAKDRQRIFRMFERVSFPGQPSGSGMGLAIVKRGVERMNGRVGVESRRGKGSRFWVELPAA